MTGWYDVLLSRSNYNDAPPAREQLKLPKPLPKDSKGKPIRQPKKK